MNQKENTRTFKSKPHEETIPPPPLSMSSSASATLSNIQIKPESIPYTLIRNINSSTDSRNMENMHFSNASMVPVETKSYTVYRSVGDIPYSSTSALREGMEMVKCLKTYIDKLTLGNKLRQDVWNRDLANLQAQSTPTTLIAVCGATGAGKSSITNALLDDNIVPTSGMRACTAVVTEIAYHSQRTIDADISFLNVSEWEQELSILQSDLVEEDGSIKRTHDLKSDAGVAWQKVHAVYPTLTQQKLVTMTVHQIIDHDPRVVQLLGGIKHISACDSRQFNEDIAEYIDSKDQSRGKNDKKKKKNDKDRQEADVSQEKDHNALAFWPLIRQVNVRCPAECLSSGCILVDLPGVADANAARNSIAKDYMKRAHCIWIVAPITRAVDDKTARDLLGDAFKMQLRNGNYDHHAITFIASKTDDISCSEVISALHLEDDPELEAIEDDLERLKEEIKEVTVTKNNSGKVIKGVEKELKSLRAIHRKHEEYIEASRNSAKSIPVLTAGAVSKPTSKKRKNQRKYEQGSSKRRRSLLESDQDNDNDMEECESDIEDLDNEIDTDTDKESESNALYNASNSDHSERSFTEYDDSDIEVETLVEEVTVRTVQAKMKQTKADIKATRARLSDARKEKEKALERLPILKKSLTKVQRTKNGWCSLKRSEFSRDVLKEDFRTGLKELDDEAAEERDPQNFDSSINQRDYEAINLPVFTCSSRDYVRLTNQVKGDGDPTCFSDKPSTGIPDLQAWCHTLTVESRTRSVNNFYDSLKNFATNISSFVSGIGIVTPEDRQAMQLKWESKMDDEDEHEHFYLADAEAESDPYTDFLRSRAEYQNIFAMQIAKNSARGITPRLIKEFGELIQDCVVQLQERFKDGLEDKCRAGASLSATSAVQILDDFAAAMHWNSYRATLRRHGEFRRNLNIELLTPFTKNIATSWGKLFETDLLDHLEETVQAVICRLLDDMVESAAIGLKERVGLQGDLCKTEADVVLKQVVALVRETINTQQKDVSRCLAPHVQNNLIDGYRLAIEETGKGSVYRQKLVFRTFLSEQKDALFDEGADVIMERLSSMCSSVGDALNVAFRELAKKIEVNLAVLWENVQDNPSEAVSRNQMLKAIEEILGQTQLWLNAVNEKAKSASTVAQALQDVDTEMN